MKQTTISIVLSQHLPTILPRIEDEEHLDKTMHSSGAGPDDF
jgi:hypothetical protein